MESVSAFISGLVRPIAVILLVGGVVWGFAEGRIEGAAFLTLAGPALAWVMAERTSSKAHEAGVQAALTLPPGAHIDEPPPTPPPGA